MNRKRSRCNRWLRGIERDRERKREGKKALHGRWVKLLFSWFQFIRIYSLLNWFPKSFSMLIGVLMYVSFEIDLQGENPKAEEEAPSFQFKHQFKHQFTLFSFILQFSRVVFFFSFFIWNSHSNYFIHYPIWLSNFLSFTVIEIAYITIFNQHTWEKTELRFD